ncbi:MAG: thioredoxin family protein [Acidimicrobiales bacterium]|nr:thioredoxin family protein [Acidimicrobiales bacterium]MCB9373476.1 thioredoxin family protein [Microthrixaceae bacterium]
MRLELLYFDDCPNWKVAAERLDDVARRRGLPVERRLVRTPEEAEAARFRGSPTILVDGEDPFASGDEPFGLACRVYQTPDGPAGSPTTAQLEEILDA